MPDIPDRRTLAEVMTVEEARAWVDELDRAQVVAAEMLEQLEKHLDEVRKIMGRRP